MHVGRWSLLPSSHNSKLLKLLVRLLKRLVPDRVTFAKGPFAERYGTRDGHARREGTTAPQRRQLGSPWPIDLTPANVRLLEVELQGSCAWSLERLKRRSMPSPCISTSNYESLAQQADHHPYMS